MAPALDAYLILKYWWKWGTVFGLLYLAKTRDELEHHNLYDTYQSTEFPSGSCQGVNLAARTLDGTCNNLSVPRMGAANTRFGRYVPLNFTDGDTPTGKLFQPNPRYMSQSLLKRDEFVPAETINLFAAAWIQFQVHDWFVHDPQNDPNNVYTFPLPANDPLRSQGQTTMSVRGTVREVHDDGRANTFINKNTHWWDMNQIYGQDQATNTKVRSFVDGKLKAAGDGLLPTVNGTDVMGFTDNWWLGLSLMHNIWMKEHNVVCDMLRTKNPTWTDQKLFDVARLIVTAENAKIHTVEWTPAMLQDDIMYYAMHANWDGLKPSFFPKIPLPDWDGLRQAWNGIVAGPPNFYGVPFAHSEEFVSVYRFHSLLPDVITVRNASTGMQTTNSYTIPQYAFGGAGKAMRDNGLTNVAYTFGVDHPGALILNNYPAAMLSLSKPGAPYTIDMGAIDILRDRERGVPRYNEFRRRLLLLPAKRMQDISDDPKTLALLRSAYGDDVEAVDLMVGCLAEKLRAPGFAFSNTQFQVFILAASRRLATDRFFTTDYKKEYYTKEGLEWIATTSFAGVIARTIPELAAAARSVDNAFKPWKVNGLTT